MSASRHRPDDHRRRRQQPVRHRARGFYTAAGRVGCRCGGHQLQRRAPGDAGVPQAHGQTHLPTGLRAAQCGKTSLRGRAQPLPLLAGVHGLLRQEIRAGRRQGGGRLLRNYARACESHEVRHSGAATGSRGGGDLAPRRATRGSPPGGSRSEVAPGGRTGERTSRHECGDHSSERIRHLPGNGRRKDAEGGRRGRHQHSGRTQGLGAHVGPGPGGHPGAAGRHRDGPSLLLPRPKSSRHAVRSSRRRRARPQESVDHHGRSAQDGRLPRCHRGIRCGFHRIDQHGDPAESWSGPRRESLRAAHRIPGGCRGQSRSAGDGP